MRKVCRLAREVLDIAARAAKPGVTTDYIDQVVHEACMEREVCLKRTRLFPPTNNQLTSLTVLPLATQLLPLPQIRLHLPQRSHLPRHPGPAPPPRRRHPQHRRNPLPRRLPR
jgi:hypothetical protein